MTRAAMGMHLISCRPSAKCMKALDAGDLGQFTDFSQMLYWFVSASCGGDVPGNDELIPPFEVSRSVLEDGSERFDIGEMPDFAMLRRSEQDGPAAFAIRSGDELPSIALNPDPDAGDGDVRERGRLKFSADSVDFFSEDGEAGYAASNRIRGVILHDVLSRVKYADDLEWAVRQSLADGEITPDEACAVLALLEERIGSASARGWFPDDADRILNEADVIDESGQLFRPDRVVISGDKVIIIDYKFGEHYRKYENQLKRYAGLWNRMGYADVSAYLWYVHTDEVIEVVAKESLFQE